MAKKNTPTRPLIRTARSYASTPADRETVEGSSLTVPGEAYSIQELYAKYSRGIPGSERKVFYSDDYDLPPEIFDPENELMDQATILEQHYDTLNEVQTKTSRLNQESDRKAESSKSAKKGSKATQDAETEEDTRSSSDSNEATEGRQS